MTRSIPRILGWSVVALAAVTMGTLILNGRLGLRGEASEKQAPADELLRADVAVLEVARQKIEITDRYTGMFRPWERYALAFELSGRVQGLNAQDEQPHYDVGMRVAKGTVLARLDRTLMQAAFDEAKAELERAQFNFGNAKRLRERNSISEAEFQDRVTELALAAARRDRAQENLDNTHLQAPADAVISLRMVQPGETVAAHAPVLELLEVDHLLLVVGVPESRIREVKVGQRVYVDLLSRDLFNRTRSAIHGSVHQIAAAADEQTGLFEVEIKISNPEGTLRPGLIADARIVVHEVDGFRLPIDVGVKREGQWMVYAVDQDDDQQVAHAVRLDEWVEQGPDLIVRDLPPEARRVVVRGQHRLQDGTAVNVVKDPNPRHEYQPKIDLE